MDYAVIDLHKKQEMRRGRFGVRQASVTIGTFVARPATGLQNPNPWLPTGVCSHYSYSPEKPE